MAKNTKSEQNEQREKAREVALKNLRSPLANLAAAYFVQKNETYGKAGGDAVYNFIYQPARGSNEGNAIMNGILQDSSYGLRYGGSVSEAQIIGKSAEIVQQSIAGIKVSDAMSLMGSKAKIDPKYADRYVADLLSEESSDTEKEVAQAIMGSYGSWLTNSKVSEALNLSAKATVGNLEKILKPEEAKKK